MVEQQLDPLLRKLTLNENVIRALLAIPGVPDSIIEMKLDKMEDLISNIDSHQVELIKLWNDVLVGLWICYTRCASLTKDNVNLDGEFGEVPKVCSISTLSPPKSLFDKSICSSIGDSLKVFVHSFNNYYVHIPW